MMTVVRFQYCLAARLLIYNVLKNAVGSLLIEGDKRPKLVFSTGDQLDLGLTSPLQATNLFHCEDLSPFNSNDYIDIPASPSRVLTSDPQDDCLSFAALLPPTITMPTPSSSVSKFMDAHPSTPDSGEYYTRYARSVAGMAEFRQLELPELSNALKNHSGLPRVHRPHIPKSMRTCSSCGCENKKAQGRWRPGPLGLGTLCNKFIRTLVRFRIISHSTLQVRSTLQKKSNKTSLRPSST
jgi:hypothetical protein